jgi:hypothetical protein
MLANQPDKSQGLVLTDFAALMKFLGSPSNKSETKHYLSQEMIERRLIWTNPGKQSSLIVTYHADKDAWDVHFVFFIPSKDSYNGTMSRQRLDKVSTDVFQTWMSANSHYIMENMK